MKKFLSLISKKQGTVSNNNNAVQGVINKLFISGSNTFENFIDKYKSGIAFNCLYLSLAKLPATLSYIKFFKDIKSLPNVQYIEISDKITEDYEFDIFLNLIKIDKLPTLHLNENSIDQQFIQGDNFKLMLVYLFNNKSITEISIDLDFVKISKEEVADLLKTWSKNPNIVKLGFIGTIEDEIFNIICEYIPKFEKLAHLGLVKNSIGDAQLEKLSSVMVDNQSILSLDLTGNCFSAKAQYGIITKLKSVKKTIIQRSITETIPIPIQCILWINYDFMPLSEKEKSVLTSLNYDKEAPELQPNVKKLFDLLDEGLELLIQKRLNPLSASPKILRANSVDDSYLQQKAKKLSSDRRPKSESHYKNPYAKK